VTATRPSTGPPRLLLGVALLFWGGVTEHALAGLLLALTVEAAHWTTLRWDFRDAAFVRAWHLGALLLLVTGAFVVLQNSILRAFPLTFTWLPAIGFPLMFVQAYGIRRDMPLATFSAMARKRRRHAREHDLPFRDIRFHFGWTYLTAILLASALGNRASPEIFFPGAVALTGWAFAARARQEQPGLPVATLVAILLAGLGGLAGEKLLDAAYRHFVLGGHAADYDDFARQTRTSIGELGEIKQSPRIIWRLRPIEGRFPRLLRVAAYNRYRNSYWGTVMPPDPIPGDFIEVDSVGIDVIHRVTGRDGQGEFIAGERAIDPEMARFTLRGMLEGVTLLPLPNDTASLVLPAQDMELNAFGTLRLKPEHAVANATIRHDPSVQTGMPPWPHPLGGPRVAPDLEIPEDEIDAIRRVAAELDLGALPLREKIQRLRGHFLENFTYSRYLENPEPRGESERSGLVGLFLEEHRRGHCEYFATAGALLLRQAGVRTRFATGFAVAELDAGRGEALIRGIHAHAWILAWDPERRQWIDVDFTPPDWTGLETPRMPPWQDFADWLAMLRTDLLVWRTQPGNLNLALLIAAIPFGIGGLMILRRLWKSRQRVEDERHGHRRRRGDSPLEALESRAARLLGPRPPGRPLAAWLGALQPQLAPDSRLPRALELHQRMRFDPDPDTDRRRDELRNLLPDLRRELEAVPHPD